MRMQQQKLNNQKRFTSPLKNTKGMTLVETIVALVLLSIVMTAVLGFLSFAINTYIRTTKQTWLQSQLRTMVQTVKNEVYVAESLEIYESYDKYKLNNTLGDEECAIYLPSRAIPTDDLYRLIFKNCGFDIVIPDEIEDLSFTFTKKGDYLLGITATGTTNKFDITITIEDEIYIENIQTLDTSDRIEGTEGSCIVFIQSTP